LKLRPKKFLSPKIDFSLKLNGKIRHQKVNPVQWNLNRATTISTKNQNSFQKINAQTHSNTQIQKLWTTQDVKDYKIRSPLHSDPKSSKTTFQVQALCNTNEKRITTNAAGKQLVQPKYRTTL
jgi:hypothetical protein